VIGSADGLAPRRLEQRDAKRDRVYASGVRDQAAALQQAQVGGQSRRLPRANRE
jgi:hypothetical protein